MSAAPPTEIYAIGLRCPWPLLRLARAVRLGGVGEYLLVADDPQTAIDLPELAVGNGWRVEPIAGTQWRVIVCAMSATTGGTVAADAGSS